MLLVGVKMRSGVEQVWPVCLKCCWETFKRCIEQITGLPWEARCTRSCAALELTGFERSCTFNFWWQWLLPCANMLMSSSETRHDVTRFAFTHMLWVASLNSHSLRQPNQGTFAEKRLGFGNCTRRPMLDNAFQETCESSFFISNELWTHLSTEAPSVRNLSSTDKNKAFCLA